MPYDAAQQLAGEHDRSSTVLQWPLVSVLISYTIRYTHAACRRNAFKHMHNAAVPVQFFWGETNVANVSYGVVLIRFSDTVDTLAYGTRVSSPTRVVSATPPEKTTCRTCCPAKYCSRVPCVLSCSKFDKLGVQLTRSTVTPPRDVFMSEPVY